MNNRMNIFLPALIILLIIAATGGVYMRTKSPFNASVVLISLSALVYFLNSWLSIPNEVPLNVILDEPSHPQPVQASPAVKRSAPAAPLPTPANEVFYISGNKYTYKDSANVCAVYDAEVASYDQVMEAFSKGAEWCGYGWSKGGMALYPTQEATWKKLQEDDDTNVRKSCGRPGVNGGYFDPNTKFGVNCFGKKPDCDNQKYPIPIGRSKKDKDAIDALKKDMKHIKVSPFSLKAWSEWNNHG